MVQYSREPALPEKSISMMPKCNIPNSFGDLNVPVCRRVVCEDSWMKGLRSSVIGTERTA